MKPFFFPCGLALAASLVLAGCNNTQTGTTSTASGSSSSSSGGSSTGDASKPTIAVIPKGTTHSFWKSVEAGAKKAGQEVGANIVFKGPVQESDRAGQIKIVEQFVSEGTKAVVLAPLDDTALMKPVREAKGKKIPVVIIDSALKGQVGTDFAAFVATNNRQGGVLAGERMVSLLKGKGKGKVAMLRYQEGSASTNERETGFLLALKKAPGIVVTSSNRYAGATSGEAKDAALNMVDKLKEADGIFAPNESSALGMLLALRQAGVAGKKTFVGFDASPPLLEGLKKGEIAALVAQNPTKMGYEGVKTAMAAIQNKSLTATVDTGVAVLTKENLGTPEAKEVLNENQ